MQVILAQPRGFCAGVVRAIEIVDRALVKHGAPVFVRHEIVHNKHVVEGLKEKGARFVEELDEVPTGAVTIFSAHGVSRAVVADASQRQLHAIDATCPLVIKVHTQGRQYAASGRTVILIGHAGHPEVEGTMGQIPGKVILVQNEAEVEQLDLPPETPVAYVTQTTLSVDDTRNIIAALARRFSNLVGPDTRDICYATQNRQSAVRDLCKLADVILVIGATNSSNSNRLRELAQRLGVPAYMVDAPEQVRPEWIAGKRRIGLTAGASAPEALAQSIVDRLRALGARQVRALEGIEENMAFPLPRGLMPASVAA